VASLRTRRPRLDPESFIVAAETSALGSEPAPAQAPKSRPRARMEGRGEPLPWDRPGVRADVTKPFNLRIPEPLKLKLDYIRKQTRVSMHEFVMGALVPAVEAELKRLRREGS
jgi:hypothetical protein